MVPIRILEGAFGSVSLGDLELLRREARGGLFALCVIVHVCLADKSLAKFYSPARSDSWLLLCDSFRGYKRSTNPIPRKSPLRRASADSVRSSKTLIVRAN